MHTSVFLIQKGIDLCIFYQAYVVRSLETQTNKVSHESQRYFARCGEWYLPFSPVDFVLASTATLYLEGVRFKEAYQSKALEKLNRLV